MNSSPFQSGAILPPASRGNLDQRFPKGKQAQIPFDAAPKPGSLNDDLLVRSTISDTFRACDKSRAQIADLMSELLGVRVTEKMLNSYSSIAMQPNRFPAAWDRAFCHATGDDTLLRCRAELAGYQVITQQEGELLELGRQYLRRKRADEQAALLERRLMGVEA
jgi:hypothetical protein